MTSDTKDRRIVFLKEKKIGKKKPAPAPGSLRTFALRFFLIFFLFFFFLHLCGHAGDRTPGVRWRFELPGRNIFSCSGSDGEDKDINVYTSLASELCQGAS